MISLNRYIGLLTVGADITQAAPERIGTAWNSLIARITNVKAGKFVASQEDMESDNYDENNFEALNDVEKVLDSVNIKLRENFGVWKDTEDIIDEIGQKWSTWDKTTQNAVATAVAGTRQREIFATTMQNYGQVSKYEQIAANSYGTAQEKMLAYTDSLEASQKRYQNALGKFALAIDRTEIVKKFYDSITFLANNAVALGTALTTVLLLVRGKEITEFLSSGVASLAVRAMNFGTKLTELSNSIGNGSVFKKAFSNVGESMRSVYESNLKEKYATQLRNTTSGILNETQQGEWLNIQDAFVFSGTNLKDSAQALTDMLGVYEHEFEDTDAIKQLRDKQRALGDTIASYDNELNNLWLKSANGEDIDEAKYQETLNNMTKAQEESTKVEQEITALKKQQQQQAVAEILNNEQYSTIRTQLLSTHQSEIDTRVKEIMQENQLEYTTENLANARRQAERETLETVLSEDNLNNANRILDQRRKEPGVGASTFVGLATIAGGSLGGLGLGNFGKQFFGDKGQVFGSLAGGIAGTNFSSTLATAITKIGTVGFKAALSSSGVIGAGIGLATIIGMSIFGWIEKSKKEKIEQQAKEFQTESDKYQSMLSASVDASKFDELSKGVDRLGRNVNLTDDEYEEFLNLNTKLAEQFPGLIKFTDGQGQAFVGAAGGANSLSESIDNLIKQQQKLANRKLLAPELFDQTYKDAKKQYDEAERDFKEKQKLGNFNLSGYGEEKVTVSELNFFKYNDLARHDTDYIKLTANTQEEYENLKKILDLNKDIQYKVSSVSHGSHKEGTDWTEITGIKLTPEDYQKVKDSLGEFNGLIKSQLAELENTLEQSKHILDSEVQAIFENLAYNDTAFEINPDFDVSKFNALSDEAKNVLRNAITGMKLTAKDGESFKFQVSDILQQLMSQLDEEDYNLIYEVGFEYDGESSYKEFIDARKKLYDLIQSLNIDDELKKKILISLEFTVDDNDTYSDNFDYIQRIRDEHLGGSFGFSNWFNILSDTYSPDELKEIYVYLKEIQGTGIKLSQEYIWDKFVVNKYTLSSTKELLNYFNQLENTTDTLGQKRLGIITDRIKELGKQLGLASENLDYLNRAFNRMPEIDQYGIVTETPEKVSEDFEDYGKIRDYLNNDFKGTWDTDMLNLVMSKEDLAPFIGNINELKKEVNSIPNEYEIAYKRAIANAMGVSEHGYQSLLNMHSDLVKKMNDNYGVDLTQYKNLEQAKSAVNAQALVLMQDGWKNYVANLSSIYAEDLKVFGNAQTQKLNMLGIVASQLGLASTNADGTKYVSGKYYNAFKAREGREMYLKGASTEEINNAALAYADKMMMQEWANKQIEGAKAEMEALMQGITIADIPIGKLGDSDKSGSGSDNKFKEQLQNALDILKNYRNLIDKEWEAMIAWDEDKQIDYGTKYFEKMRENLSGQINATQAIMNEWNTKGKKIGKDGSVTYWDIDSGEQITQKEFMDQINTYEADLIELQKELNNLDDEELQDAMNLMETKKAIADLEDERLGVYENYNRYLSKSEQSYRRQKENLEQQLYIARQMLNSTTDTEEEHYVNLQKVKELERQIADLDYEEQEHRISILESVDASVYALIDAQKVLLENARTQEEMIEGQNKLNDLLEQERELRKSIFDFQRQNAERSNQYYSGTAYSDSDRYNSNYELQVQSIEAMKNIAQEKMEDEFRKAYKQYITELDEATGARKWTDDEAYEMAGQTEEYMSAYNEWFEFSQQIADLAVQKMQDQLAELDSMLDRAERAKPDDWSYYEQISEYSNEQLDILQKKKVLLEESLQDVSTWTDEQIKQATDELNNVVEAINDALINTKQEQINYQDRQFDALISYLERMREEYNDLRDDVEEYYDALLKPLEQEIDDRQKVNELIELQNNLLKANEKSRV